MTEEDGIQACLLEEEFAELGGWEAESDASRILQGLGIGVELGLDQTGYAKVTKVYDGSPAQEAGIVVAKTPAQMGAALAEAMKNKGM